MFLNNNEYTLQDFMQALSFIPPKGTTVAYFISPKAINVPEGSGFAPQELKDIPPDESQTYQRIQPVQKIDQAATPGEYSVIETSPLGRRQPTPSVLPDVVEPDDLDSPFVKVLSESKMFGNDLLLLENYGPFLKNSIFHCTKSRISD
jgi:hypothetical protein